MNVGGQQVRGILILFPEGGRLPQLSIDEGIAAPEIFKAGMQLATQGFAQLMALVSADADGERKEPSKIITDAGADMCNACGVKLTMHCRSHMPAHCPGKCPG